MNVIGDLTGILPLNRTAVPVKPQSYPESGCLRRALLGPWLVDSAMLLVGERASAPKGSGCLGVARHSWGNQLGQRKHGRPAQNDVQHPLELRFCQHGLVRVGAWGLERSPACG